MENQNSRKWSVEEDEILLRYVKAGMFNLSKTFIMVSEHLTDNGTPRTPGAVSSHWYTVVSRKPEALCFFTASSKHVAKNRKNGKGVDSTPSIWRRLLAVIRNL